MGKIRAAVVGGTGYTGAELIRILLGHPKVDLKVVTSRGAAGTPLDQYFPTMRGLGEGLTFTAPDEQAYTEVDLVFFATPHATAMYSVPALLDQGKNVIDLSADYRIKDVGLWEQWYGVAHTSSDWVARAVYGLPELNRSAIKGAQLIANPGCYPTSVQLALKPLLEAGLISTRDIVADCKSGASGAGRQAKVNSLFCEVGENFKAYGVAGHRHLPEIEQGLSWMANSPLNVTFVPHLLPMIRGIESTVYATLDQAGLSFDEKKLWGLYQEAYTEEPFVDVLALGEVPATANVRGGNVCQLSIFRPLGKEKLVVLSVIDNLLKGAAGQAVQNMNICYEWPETMGLTESIVWP